MAKYDLHREIHVQAEFLVVCGIGEKEVPRQPYEIVQECFLCQTFKINLLLLASQRSMQQRTGAFSLLLFYWEFRSDTGHRNPRMPRPWNKSHPSHFLSSTMLLLVDQCEQELLILGSTECFRTCSCCPYKVHTGTPDSDF